jgi:type I restriction enzyme S subunit
MSSNKSEPLKNGWLKLRFEQIAENIVDHVEIPSESGYERFVGGDHLDSECLRIKSWGSTNDVDAQKLLFKKGHILFGKRNAYLRKVAYADFDGVCSAHMMVLKSKPEFIEERFFPFFMQTDQFWERADMISEGSMSPTIKWKTLAKQEFMIPPKEEQRHIADILWAAEDYITKNEGLADEIKLYKKIFIKELLTKGIEHGWEVAKIENIIPEKKGAIKIGPFGSQLKKDEMVYNGIKVYGQENVLTNNFSIGSRYISNDKFLTLKTVEIYPEDVLITRMGSVGYSTVFPQKAEKGIMDFHLMRIRVDKSKCYPIFLSRLINDADFIKNQIKAMSQGTIMSGLNSQIVRKIEIPLPALSEQRRIIEIFSKLDDTIQKVQENIYRTKELRKMLINRFLNWGLGEVFSINSQAKQLYETQVSE